MTDTRFYLGDGVYAEFEDGMIKLTTNNGVSVTNTIYLEHEVFDALKKYAEWIGWVDRLGITY